MSEGKGITKLLIYSMLVTIAISSGFFVLELNDCVGTITSTNQTEVSILNMWITPFEDKINIKINFFITNPTAYSRIKIQYIHYNMYLKTNSAEEFIGKNTYFIHETLIPHKELSFNSSFYVQKSKNEYLSTYGPISKLKWRINCLTLLETPLKNNYQVKDIYIESNGPLGCSAA